MTQLADKEKRFTLAHSSEVQAQHLAGAFVLGLCKSKRHTDASRQGVDTRDPEKTGHNIVPFMGTSQ